MAIQYPVVGVTPFPEAAATVNDNFRQISDMLASVGGLGRTITMGNAGDSISDNAERADAYSPIYQARSTIYDADFVLDGRPFADGGMGFAVGGTNTAHMLSTQLPQLKQRVPKALHLSCFQNNGVGNRAVADATFADATSFASQALDAGVEAIFWMGVVPYTGFVNGNRVYALHYLNDRMRNWATRIGGNVAYLDILGLLKSNDMAIEQAGEVRWRGAAGSIGGTGIDTAHVAPYGAVEQSRLLADAYRRYFREHQWPTYSGLPFDNARNPWGNYFPQGVFNGTDGTRTGTSTGPIPNGWNLSVPDVGVTVTSSIITDARGSKSWVLDIAGTPTADGIIACTTNADSAADAGQWSIYCRYRYENVVGLAGTSVSVQGSGVGGAGQRAHIMPGTVTRTYKARDMYPRLFGNSFNGIQGAISHGLIAGVEVNARVIVDQFGFSRVA
jgi:hypothetical protein